MTRTPKRRPGTILFALGALMLLAALLLVLYNLWDDWRAGRETAALLTQIEVETPAASVTEQQIPDYVLDPTRDMPTVELDGEEYIGTLEIPALGLSLPVMSEWSYPRLKIAPCRYVGTAYQPGFVIAAHNYTSHFGRLKELTEGDSVTFTDADGNVFTYRVAAVEVLAHTAVEDMVSDEWDLSLFTCTIGGQTRLTVRCEVVSP